MKFLVVVDMQNDFIDGVLGSPEAQAIVPAVQGKIAQAIENNDCIIYTRDTHFENYLSTKEGKALPIEHCIHGTPGWQIPDILLPPDDYRNYEMINKPTFGELYVGEFIGAEWNYSGRSYPFEIELIGLCTDICVVSNALLLKAQLGCWADISVDSSCCAGTTPEKHEAALEIMRSCQINVI